MNIDRRRSSVIVIHNKKLLGFDAEDPLTHQRYFFLPGGMIEEDESVARASIRETREETGYEIEILEGIEVRGVYNFDWNGHTYVSETTFLAGRLTSEVHALVEDGDYHRGVRWIDIDQISKEFSYHRDICEAVQHITDEILKD